MTEKLISQGAEAHVLKGKKGVIKHRKAKAYRYPALDHKLRTQRTRQEAKLLAKAAAIINVPKIGNITEDTIVMEEIKGKKLADSLDSMKNKLTVCKEIGKSVARMHDANIIHGDLTTSNILYSNKKVYLIDFGLGYISGSVEDKAVDLHVLKGALDARHPKSASMCFKAVLEGYSISKDSAVVLKRFSIVQLRGRYKQQY